jgi:hypothetical protein
MRFYHGSAKVFKEFDKNTIGQNFSESERSGFFFSENRGAARGHANDMSQAGETGFVFEVDLVMDNPIKEHLTNNYSTPVDHFDRNPMNFIQEAYIHKNDSVYITSEHGDNLAIVFEPEQVNILKIYEGDTLVFDADKPDDTLYPNILGPHAISNANKGAKPFHHHGYDENTLSSIEFGQDLSAEAKAELQNTGAYSNKGIHFGVGSEFANAAFMMLCDAKIGDANARQCRTHCLVIHDFGLNLTMIKDLSGKGDAIPNIMKRPLVDVEGVIKNFSSNEERHQDRSLSQAIGPKTSIDEFIADIPEYMSEIVSLSRPAQLVEQLVNKPNKRVPDAQTNTRKP